MPARSKYTGLLIAIGDSVTMGKTGTGPWVTTPFAEQVRTELGAGWVLRKYGGGGMTSTMAAHKSSVPPGVAANPVRGWQWQRPNVAIIMLGINNNLTGGIYYADIAAGMAAWTADVPDIVNRLIANGTPANHILVCGHPPWTVETIATWKGLYMGGLLEDTFQKWNGIDDHTADGIMSAITSTGCTFVPMHDVYGAAYDIDADAGDYVQGSGPGNMDSHPNQAGHDAIATRIISYLPSPVTTGRLA